jgi:hypothetical protein
MSPADEPPFNARLAALHHAAANVIDEWGNGDNINPDRMDTVIAILREALADEP